jgi:SAM-dependent methyltransferase
MPVCPLCGAAGSRVRHVEEWLTIRRCPACSFLFTEDREGDFRGGAIGREIAEFYAFLESYREARVAYLGDRLRGLLARTRSGAEPSVFEIGYGGGALARAATALGCRYTGLEPLLGEAFHAEAAALPPGARLLPLRFEEFETAERFDLVAMDNVLEHLADPVGTVRRALALLRPGGLLWAQVPNERNLVLKHRLLSLLKDRRITFPGHVNLFTARTLRRCFREAGAPQVEIGGTSASHPVLAHLLLTRPPGPLLAAGLGALRVSRLDLLGGWAYWLDAYCLADGR